MLLAAAAIILASAATTVAMLGAVEERDGIRCFTRWGYLSVSLLICATVCAVSKEIQSNKTQSALSTQLMEVNHQLTEQINKNQELSERIKNTIETPALDFAFVEDRDNTSDGSLPYYAFRNTGWGQVKSVDFSEILLLEGFVYFKTEHGFSGLPRARFSIRLPEWHRNYIYRFHDPERSQEWRIDHDHSRRFFSAIKEQIIADIELRNSSSVEVNLTFSLCVRHHAQDVLGTTLVDEFRVATVVGGQNYSSGTVSDDKNDFNATLRFQATLPKGITYIPDYNYSWDKCLKEAEASTSPSEFLSETDEFWSGIVLFIANVAHSEAAGNSE